MFRTRTSIFKIFRSRTVFRTHIQNFLRIPHLYLSYYGYGIGTEYGNVAVLRSMGSSLEFSKILKYGIFGDFLYFQKKNREISNITTAVGINSFAEVDYYL